LSDNYNQTSLLLAVKNGHEAVVKLLLENGDTDSQDGNQGGALSWATRKTREAVAILKNI
jgi:ankyrin repeat protein